MRINKEYNPNRKWTFEEKEKAIEQKRIIVLEQNGMCPVCNKPLSFPVEAAHRIPKSKTNIKTLGWSVINHRFNLRATHNICNSSVLMDTGSRPEECKRLIELIREDLAR